MARIASQVTAEPPCARSAAVARDQRPAHDTSWRRPPHQIPQSASRYRRSRPLAGIALVTERAIVAFRRRRGEPFLMLPIAARWARSARMHQAAPRAKALHDLRPFARITEQSASGRNAASRPEPFMRRPRRLESPSDRSVEGDFVPSPTHTMLQDLAPVRMLTLPQRRDLHAPGPGTLEQNAGATRPATAHGL